jgi:hypothetical protein
MFITNNVATWKYVKTKHTKPINHRDASSNLDRLEKQMYVVKDHEVISQ